MRMNDIDLLLSKVSRHSQAGKGVQLGSHTEWPVLPTKAVQVLDERLTLEGDKLNLMARLSLGFGQS